MKVNKLIDSYLLLPKKQKKTVNIIIIILLLFIIYIIGFYICKAILIGKAKDFLVEKGIGTSKNSIVLKVSIDPFTCFAGRVHKLDLYVDQVMIQNITYIHNLQVHTKGFDARKLNSIANGLDVGGTIEFDLLENDFLSILNQKLQNNVMGLNVTSNQGMIQFNTGFSSSSARPYLRNNCIYLDFNAKIFNVPIKVIDIRQLTKNRLNIYEFNYSNGAYNFKGTVI